MITDMTAASVPGPADLDSLAASLDHLTLRFCEPGNRPAQDECAYFNGDLAA